MKLAPATWWIRWSMIGSLAAVGGVGGAFPGCDDDVREVFVQGLEETTVNLIQDLLNAVKPGTSTGGGTTVPTV